MRREMAKILIHLTHGPEHPTRAALTLLITPEELDRARKITVDYRPPGQ